MLMTQESPDTSLGGVVVSDLSKSFGPVHAVRGINVSIAPGETVALLGPNGAGKSTTIDMLLGLTAPDGGAVSVFGLPPAEAMLTTFGRAGYLRRAMEAGARGFIVKDAPAEQLADAVRRVAAGERVVDPALAAATLAGGSSPLTGRERDVLASARGGATVPTSPPSCFSPKAPCATTCRRP
jgi:ABC-type hemin transport system ATPase subunit